MTIGESVEYYTRLGCNELLRHEAPGGDHRIVHLGLDGFVLELFHLEDHDPAPASTQELQIDLRTIGVKHLALEVSSIEEARDHLMDMGYADEDVEISEGKTGIRYLFLEDPSGNFLEIVEDGRDLS